MLKVLGAILIIFSCTFIGMKLGFTGMPLDPNPPVPDFKMACHQER